MDKANGEDDLRIYFCLKYHSIGGGMNGVLFDCLFSNLISRTNFWIV